LTACAPAREAPIVTKIERVVVRPPAALLACPDEPAIPADLTSQDQLAQLLPDLVLAGRACRARLPALREFFDDVSKQKRESTP
jgi:hypothetical protein